MFLWHSRRYIAMRVLGIECTAHTFGASVVDASGSFLSNEKASFTSAGKGMVPREVLEFHRKHRDEVLRKALEPAPGKIDAIAVSQGPGIGTLLHEGIEFSKALSAKMEIPLFGVNHAVAHFEIGVKECRATDPVFLYVSGGNTQVVVRETAGKWMATGGQGGNGKQAKTAAKTKYRVVGETLDIGLGNLLDKSARVLGLGFPGGPLLYDLSLKSTKFIDLPYSIKGMDVCFSGLATAFKNKAESGGFKQEDLAFSLQEVAFDIVCEASERALAHFGKDELVLAGGVACSKVLQQKAKSMCEERGAKLLVPSNAFLTDNAAMIAYNGFQLLKAGAEPLEKDAKALPHWRPDEVDIDWA